MTGPTPRSFTFGELLDGAFTLYRHNFALFFGVALLPQVPVVLFWLVAPATLGSLGTAIGSILLAPYSWFVTFLTLGALTHAVAAAFQARAPGIVDALMEGLRQWLFVTIAGILAGILVLAGFLFFIIPGFFFIALLFAVVPVVVIEGRGPLESFSRSARLSRGGRMRILGIMLVTWIITLLPMWAMWTLVALAGGGLEFFSPEAADPTAASMWQAGVLQALSPVVSAFTWPFWAGVTVLLYLDRRARTEAPDLEAAMDELQAEA